MDPRILATPVSSRIPRILLSLSLFLAAGTVQITRRLTRQETRARVPLALPAAIARSYVTIVLFALRAQADLARKRGAAARP